MTLYLMRKRRPDLENNVDNKVDPTAAPPPKEMMAADDKRSSMLISGDRKVDPEERKAL